MIIECRGHLRIQEDLSYSLRQVFETLQPPIDDPSTRFENCRIPSTLIYSSSWPYGLYDHLGYKNALQNTDQLDPPIQPRSAASGTLIASVRSKRMTAAVPDYIEGSRHKGS
jgi:hypothetical protein